MGPGAPGLRPVLYLTLACCLIPLGDAIAKFGNAFHGIPIEFLAWSRFALGACLLFPFAVRAGMRVHHVFAPAALLRGTFISATVWLILQGASRAPLADVFGAFFVAPLLSFVLAVVFLKERPGMFRTGLAVVGFVGVLLIAKPAGGLSAGMAFALASGVTYGLFLTANRVMSAHPVPLALLFTQLAVGAVGMAPSGAFSGWAALEIGSLWVVIASALTSVVANFFIILAYREAEASRLAPVIYVQLVAATIFGLVVFGDVPDPAAAVGIALLISSGFATLLPRRR